MSLQDRPSKIAKAEKTEAWSGVDKKWGDALGLMVHGIYVLTTSCQDEVNGMIASWASQLSFDPPLVAVAVHPNRYSHRLIEKSRAFALHTISRDQKDFLKLFKGPDPAAKFTSLRWSKGVTGAPLLSDCLAYVDCRVKTTLSPGNHTLFIGEVVDGGIVSRGVPLSTLDYEGVYTGEK
jgi:flavin reductase (DIM6/NTAB) family NADH-FMN oxidoreductase RutF